MSSCGDRLSVWNLKLLLSAIFDLRKVSQSSIFCAFCAAAIPLVALKLTLTLLAYAIPSFIVPSSHIDTMKPSFAIYEILLILLGALNEELQYRGFILRTLIDHGHQASGMIICSILFSLIHRHNTGFSMLPFINLFLFAILASNLYVRGGLLTSTTFHFSWNICLYFLHSPLSGYGGDEHSSSHRHWDAVVHGGVFGFEGSIVLSILTLLCAALLRLPADAKSLV